MPGTLALLNDVGGGELIVIAIIGLLLFGRELPVIARKCGRILAEFKRGVNEAGSEIRREMNSAADLVEDAKQNAASTSEIRRHKLEIDEAIRRGRAPRTPAAEQPAQPELLKKMEAPTESEPRPAADKQAEPARPVPPAV